MTLSLVLQMIVVIFGLSLPGLLHDNQLPGWVNGLVALLVITICSFFMTLVGGSLTGNRNEDIGLFIIIASILLIGPLRPLLQDLQRLPGLGRLLSFLKTEEKYTQRYNRVKRRLDNV